MKGLEKGGEIDGLVRRRELFIETNFFTLPLSLFFSWVCNPLPTKFFGQDKLD